VSKSGLIDAISTTTSLANSETAHAVHAPVFVLVIGEHTASGVPVANVAVVNPTERDVRMYGIDATTWPDTLQFSRSTTNGAAKVSPSFVEKGLKKRAHTSTNKAARRIPALELAGNPSERSLGARRSHRP
jgi:hypothetical protein